MTVASKILTIVNMVLSLLFLALAITVPVMRLDLKTELREAETKVREQDDKLKGLTDEKAKLTRQFGEEEARAKAIVNEHAANRKRALGELNQTLQEVGETQKRIDDTYNNFKTAQVKLAEARKTVIARNQEQQELLATLKERTDRQIFVDDQLHQRLLDWADVKDRLASLETTLGKVN